MKKRKSTLLEQFNSGQNSTTKYGIPNRMNSLFKYTLNIQEGRFYLVGGDSGAGKTTFVDSAFVLQPYDIIFENKKLTDIDISWTYFSLEQSARTKHGRWASSIYYKLYGEMVPSSVILGRSVYGTSVDKERIKKVDEYLERLLDKVNIEDSSLDSEDFYNYLVRYGRKEGKWVMTYKRDSFGKIIIENGKKVTTFKRWIPNNKKKKHKFVIDHLAYLASNDSLKKEMDNVSRIIAQFRELTNWTFVVIQQFNTELGNVERQRFKRGALSPNRQDFGDTKYTYRDADVVIGMVNPTLYGILGEYQKQENLEMFHGLAVWTFLLKNRHDGPSGEIQVPPVSFLMNPISLDFVHIPDPPSEAMQFINNGNDNGLAEVVELADKIKLITEKLF